MDSSSIAALFRNPKRLPIEKSSIKTALPPSQRAAFELFVGKVLTSNTGAKPVLLFGQTIAAGLVWDEAPRCTS